MAIVTRLSLSGTPGIPYGSFAGKVGITWSFVSDDWPLVYDDSVWGTRTLKLESWLRATTGTVYVRLVEVTSVTDLGTIVGEVSSSQLNHNTTTRTRKVSSALTLTDTKVYRAQTGKGGSDAGFGKCRLLVE